ncbi:hypothetical protein AVEN_71046-1 [Araneus ventricosus]|uniref:Uncharacterized protein n=1 Tax=Araneus ventricosus TaxID=182803 RepID=A0A4Y2IHL4_ARAVE|nr:hypothetical protein AVEN_71046-1 [Araneus ventricosus]
MAVAKGVPHMREVSSKRDNDPSSERDFEPQYRVATSLPQAEVANIQEHYFQTLGLAVSFSEVLSVFLNILNLTVLESTTRLLLASHFA